MLQTNNTQDPFAERLQALDAIVNAGVIQDLDFLSPYCWLHHAALPPQFAKFDAYDFVNDPAFASSLRGATQKFHDLSLRSVAPSTNVIPTNGIYGAGTGPAFTIYGPYSDPALRSAPPGMRVVLKVT